MSDILHARIEAMRLSFYDNSPRNRLINLPADGSRRILVLQGSARAIRDALDAGQVLEIGKDVETQISLPLAREILCEILRTKMLCCRIGKDFLPSDLVLVSPPGITRKAKSCIMPHSS